MKEKENLHQKTDKGGLNFFNIALKLTKNQNKTNSWLLSDGWL